MKRSTFASILIACLVVLVSGVSYASHERTYFDKVLHDEAEFSKIVKVANDLGLELQKAILNEVPDSFKRLWVPVDYSASKLPDHNLLPTNKLWLLNCAIRQC